MALTDNIDPVYVKRISLTDWNRMVQEYKQFYVLYSLGPSMSLTYVRQWKIVFLFVQ